MAIVRFDHTIVPSTDKHRSADFYAALLGLAARSEPPFTAVDLGNDATFYFGGWDTEVAPQHYCFCVGEDDFDRILGLVTERGMEYWADPSATRAGQVNHDDGGRGMYFRDPDGHFLEVITVRYGGRPHAYG